MERFLRFNLLKKRFKYLKYSSRHDRFKLSMFFLDYFHRLLFFSDHMSNTSPTWTLFAKEKSATRQLAQKGKYFSLHNSETKNCFGKWISIPLFSDRGFDRFPFNFSKIESKSRRKIGIHPLFPFRVLFINFSNESRSVRFRRLLNF